MRILLLFPALIYGTTVAWAQEGTTAPAQNPDVGQLDAVLIGWEKSMASLRSLHAECQRTTLDKVFQTKEVFTGAVKCVKPPLPEQHIRASLEFHKRTAQGPSPTVFEKYVFDGRILYDYAPAFKVVRVHDLSATEFAKMSGNNYLSFLFGMNAAEATQRFELTLTTGAADFVTPTPTDKHYYYVRVRPKHTQDKADFTIARLVLRRDSFLPVQMWFQQPNGNVVTWDVNVQGNIAIPATEFERPRLAAGWRFER